MRLMWRKKQESSVRLTRSESDDDTTWALKNAIATHGFPFKDEDMADDEIEQPPINRLVNTIIQAAIKERASDIHIEPDKRNTRIRYRVDGILHEIIVVPQYIQEPLIARLREIMGLPSESTALPQSGLITFQFLETDYRLRVHLLPTQYGEKIVLHICKQVSALLGLSKSGMTPETQGMFEEALIQSGGLIVFAGHTGSGRTTTQFNALNRMNTIERTSFVIGQRLEYELSGVAFVQVDPKAGSTYEEAIAAVRYESPSIVMLDQIPDVNVWRAALDLAHSGTIVLASVCANDSVAALIRLRDMGISSSVLASSVSGVLAQRLVRRVCPRCKEDYEEDAVNLRRFGFLVTNTEQKVSLVRGRGCEQCRNTGYLGRVGVFDFLHKSFDSVEALLNYDGLPLRKKLLQSRWKTFSDDLVIKLTSHVTTPEEALRVFSPDYGGDLLG